MSNIVHSDTKTSNILIQLSENSQKYAFKLIDYGSSFFFAHLDQYRLATPEYMPPELITYLNFRSGKEYNVDLFEFTKNYTNISAIDMWGLGCILL
jgi:serine/threonine protein kinase